MIAIIKKISAKTSLDREEFNHSDILSIVKICIDEDEVKSFFETVQDDISKRPYYETQSEEFFTMPLTHTVLTKNGIIDKI